MTETNFDAAYNTIAALVKDFKASEAHHLSPAYSEAQVRKDYIDKFWTALGWDVNHNTQRNPYEQEVKVELSQRQGNFNKHADYAFSLAPNFRDTLFIVEAKKPNKNLRDADCCFQAVRYGYNAGNPFVILHDFEQLLVLNSTRKPNVETASAQALTEWHYTRLLDKEEFSKIYYWFSREAVAEGAIQQRAIDFLKPKGKTATQGKLFKTDFQAVDDDFLADLENQREALAKAFKKTSPQLDGEALTEITQRVLDRLIFIRFLEDRGIENKGHIEEIIQSSNPWKTFTTRITALDRIYNGIVFKALPLLDTGTPPDEDDFADIVKTYAPKESEYDFNHIPIHILGSIYERFLGKIIVTTDKRARVEEKPEVRKAGGVYYTPEYIVRYIVENTIGKLIDGKTPAQVAKMRFADIACGSGSFLLGAYDYLLRWHSAYYNTDPTTAKNGEIVKTEDGGYALTLNKRQEILTNNIYGVDLDLQAVEVAQVSLYLRLLQDETAFSAKSFQIEFHKTMLPSLGSNIINGNSLIGTNIMEGELNFSATELRKLNPLDFDAAFPEVFRNGRGFDAVIGNPPYVRIQGFSPDQIRYFGNTYKAATGNFDLYISFVERGYNILKKDGELGYIVPNKFFKTDYGVGLRKLLSELKALKKVVDFGANQVFEATTYTCLLFLKKSNCSAFDHAESAADQQSLNSLKSISIKAEKISEKPWSFGSDEIDAIIEKLNKGAVRLLDLPAGMSRGSSSGADTVYLVEDGKPQVEEEILRVPVFASDFNRYTFQPSGKWKIIFPYVKQDDGTFMLIREKELKTRFPQAYAYLRLHLAELEKRKQYTSWYGYSAPRNLELHDKAQIFVPLLANKGLFSLIPKGYNGKLCPMASGGFTIALRSECTLAPEYVLGLINSKLLFWKLAQLSNIFRGGWITCTKQYFGELPIKILNLKDAKQKLQYDKMVQLVKNMLDAQEKVAAAKTEADRTIWQRLCSSLDTQIDDLVYKIYEITPHEIALIETSN